MSWRAILIIIVVVIGAAGVSGTQLGDWLVSRAPTAAPPPHAAGPDEDTVLDADGRPYLAQPPQPRLNGTLGIPESHSTQWDVPMVSLFETVSDPSVLISREKATPESLQLVTSGASPMPQETPPQAPASSTEPVQPVYLDDPGYPTTVTPTTVTTPAPAPRQSQQWQAALRHELQVCADTMGFFERPSCAWAARRKYCEPNNAWGTIRECPER